MINFDKLYIILGREARIIELITFFFSFTLLQESLDSHFLLIFGFFNKSRCSGICFSRWVLSCNCQGKKITIKVCWIGICKSTKFTLLKTGLWSFWAWWNVILVYFVDNFCSGKWRQLCFKKSSYFSNINISFTYNLFCIIFRFTQ